MKEGWKNLERIERLLGSAKLAPGAYVTVSAMLKGGGERAVGRADFEQVDDVVEWVQATLNEHRERGVAAKYRVRLWGAGGKPAGSASTRYEGDEPIEPSPKPAAPASEPTKPPTTPAPCASCISLQIEVEQLRGQLREAQVELQSGRSREHRVGRVAREQEQQLHQLRADLRRSLEKREATKAKLRGSQVEAARLQDERDSLQRTCSEQAEQIADLKATVAVLMDQAIDRLEKAPSWMLA
jgi:hypothetical protein